MKIFSVLAEFVLLELSIVSSLSLYSILVQHACNDHAWLTFEGALPNFAFFSCPNGAYKQSFGKSIGSVLKLSLGEVRELSSGSKKFLQSTEFTLEKS